MNRRRGRRRTLAAVVALGLAPAACSPDPTHLGDLPEAALVCDRDDAIVASEICFENTAREFAVSIEPLHLVTGDFTGTADLDVMAVGRRAGAIGGELWIGSQRGPLGPPVDPMVTGCSAFPVAGPLLASGRDDILFATCSPHVDVFPGGDAGFGVPVPVELPVSLRSTVIADFEGDGDTDLVVLGEDADGIAALSVVMRQPDGSLSAPSLQPLSTLSFDPSGSTAADFDGDGLLDLAIRRGSVAGSLGYVLGAGPGVFADPVRLTTDLRAWTLATADFDADGDDDLVYADDEARQVCTWIVDAVPDPQPRCLTVDDFVPTHLAAADLDDDGVAEVVFADATAPMVWVWRVDLAGEADVMEPLPVPAPTELAILVDFDADGRRDLLAGHFTAQTFSIRLAVP